MAGPGDYARVNAAWALLEIDPTTGKEVFPVARAVLKAPDLRGTAAGLLAKLGPTAAAALPDLRAALKDLPARDDDWSLDRVSVLTAIGAVDPAGVPEAVAGLREVLRTSKAWKQSFAADALRKFGPAAGPAVPELLAYGRSRADGVFRVGLARTFGEIGPGASAAEPLLREWATGEDEDLRQAATDALGRITGKPGPK
jgi:HEAT repeat protein